MIEIYVIGNKESVFHGLIVYLIMINCVYRHYDRPYIGLDYGTQNKMVTN